MVFGLSLPAFTIIARRHQPDRIAAGLIFFGALATGRWTSFVNGTFLDFSRAHQRHRLHVSHLSPIAPPFIFGVISIVLLAISFFALYVGKLQGRVDHSLSRHGALIAQWLNMVVLVVAEASRRCRCSTHSRLRARSRRLLAGQGLVLLIILFFAWKTIVRPSWSPAASV